MAEDFHGPLHPARAVSGAADPMNMGRKGVRNELCRRYGRCFCCDVEVSAYPKPGSDVQRAGVTEKNYHQPFSLSNAVLVCETCNGHIQTSINYGERLQPFRLRLLIERGKVGAHMAYLRKRDG